MGFYCITFIKRYKGSSTVREFFVYAKDRADAVLRFTYTGYTVNDVLQVRLIEELEVKE